MRKEIKEEFDHLFTKVLNLDGDCTLEAVTQQNVASWDSLRHAELMIKLQKKFKIRFDVVEMMTAHSYEQLHKLVKEKTKGFEPSFSGGNSIDPTDRK